MAAWAVLADRDTMTALNKLQSESGERKKPQSRALVEVHIAYYTVNFSSSALRKMVAAGSSLMLVHIFHRFQAKIHERKAKIANKKSEQSPL